MIFGRSKEHEERFARHTVPAGEAERVEARIGMNVGTLRVSGGATTLADGAFRYTADLEPVLSYEESGGTGKLAICQRTPASTPRHRGRNEWDIALSDAVPLDLAVVHSTGEASFDLSSLSLRSLELDRATGTTRLTLRGEQRDLHQVRVESATGSLDLDLTGRYAALSSLDVSGGTGGLEADLRGTWERDAAVSLRVATGSVRVRLPDDIGIELRGSTALGRVRVSGLAVVPGGWRRDAPSGAPVMRLDVSAGVGSVTIEANP
ncbi:MAG TPA: toast rack family protein [Thermomicrobiales bacterium]|nr:toast rack family protein [Thermomicrobiales bacterium]